MSQYQGAILAWIAAQPWLTGAVILGAGLLSTFCGYRMSRLLLPAACAAAFWLGAVIAAPHLELPPVITAAAAAGVAGAAGIAWLGLANLVGGAAIWGVLGGYVLSQFGLKGMPVLIGMGLAGCTGAVMALVCRRTMSVLLTSLLGGGLIIVGFVGVAGTILPTFSESFLTFAKDWPLSVPLLLTMLVATGYTCQANCRQGDLFTGPAEQVGAY
ncbi:MAG: hypothetical protein AB1716_02195 [Planctomycetota bacterium]